MHSKLELASKRRIASALALSFALGGCASYGPEEDNSSPVEGATNPSGSDQLGETRDCPDGTSVPVYKPCPEDENTTS
ncbi:MAG: hypothetical protein AAFY84_07245 [Pseudomonadota bacterium]